MVDVLEDEAHAYTTVDRLLDEFGDHVERRFPDVELPLTFVAASRTQAARRQPRADRRTRKRNRRCGSAGDAARERSA